MLVRLFAQTVPLTAGYWPCWPIDRRRSPKIVRFRQWLVAESETDPAIAREAAASGPLPATQNQAP